MDLNDGSSHGAPDVPAQVQKALQLYQTYLDRAVPFVQRRWIAAGVLLTLFNLRVIFCHGWYVVCYGLWIFLLNIFLGFLSPKFDPQTQDDMRSSTAEEGGVLDPVDTTSHEEEDEFRPFMRRLPEFEFWYMSVRAIVIAFVLTLTRWTDIEVFWPILVIYFVILFFLTMKRQIQHMIEYRYLPFDIGKKKFNPMS